MRNLAIDALRAKKRHGETPLEESWEERTSQETRPGDTEGLPLFLPRALPRAALCRQAQRAIVLAYRHGLSHQEIVTHTQTPLGTVKSWIRRGLGSSYV